MKNYEDIAERVFKKGDAILEKKRRKTAFIKRVSFAVSGLCVVIIAGLGIWNNHYLKNAVYIESPDIIDNQEISENDMPVTTQTSFSAAEKISTTFSDSAVFSLQTTISGNLFQENNISVTTSSGEISPVYINNHSEDLSKKTISTVKQTTANKTKQTTASTTTQAVIMTETTDISQDIYYERSLKMKKLASFVSALTIAFSAMPTISNASGVPFKVNPVRYWEGESKIFSAMESGELDVDINGNGEFDIMDCYLLDSYCSQYYSYEENIDPEIIQRIESIADYNGDGTVDFDDTLKLMRYFIIDGNICMKYLDPAYYDPDIEPLTTEEQLINFADYKEIQAYCFPMRMYYHVMYLEAEYYLIDELYQNGTVDLDFNGNGILDIDDVYCASIYCMENDSEVMHQLLTDEEYARCDSFFYHISEHLVPYHYFAESMPTEIASYILNHIDINQEYFTIAYCKENIEDYKSEYLLPSTLRKGALKIGIEVSDNIAPSYDIHDMEIEMDEFNPIYDKFCADIENGTRPLPDVNLDGVVDYIDYFDINIYYNDMVLGKAATERSILPEKTWKNIKDNYTKEGGTFYEFTAIQLYIMENTEEIADIDGAYNEYVESLVQAKENGIEITYNEDIAVLSEERSGDANNDGNTDISDAVLIMQSLSNPNEYKLTEQGAFNADVCNTGDGVTAMDALQIQLWSIGM